MAERGLLSSFHVSVLAEVQLKYYSLPLLPSRACMCLGGIVDSCHNLIRLAIALRAAVQLSKHS